MTALEAKKILLLFIVKRKIFVTITLRLLKVRYRTGKLSALLLTEPNI